MPTLRPIGHHTVESLNASNAIRRAILADARKPHGGATVDVGAAVQKVTVRNASRDEPPLPRRPPDVIDAAPRVAAPAPRSVSMTPCTRLPRPPLSDDSWQRFVHHLQNEGRTPGAMHDDPAAGVVYSTNVRPRAVTSFLRQSKAQADLSPQPQADTLASRRSTRALTLAIISAARLSSASEDEGIGLGPSPGEPSSPAATATPRTPVARPNGICMALGEWDVQAASEDDGHGRSRSSSPASPDEEGSVWRGHWAGLDSWRLPPSARNVDVIRYGVSLTEKTALPAPVPGAFAEPSGSDDGDLDDDIPDSWLDDNEIIDHAALENSDDDDWAPGVIEFADPVNDIRDRPWLDFSEGEEIDCMAPPDESLMPYVVEECEEEDVPRRRPLSVDEYREYRTLFEARLTKANERLSATSCEDLALIDGEYAKQPSRLTFVGMDLAVHTDSNESLDEAETRLAYIRTKPGPGRRADLGPEYTVELASTSPWVPSGRKGILRTSSPLVSSILPPPALADTPAIEGDRHDGSLRFSDDAMLASGASPLPPLASWVDDSSDEEVIYV